MRHRIGVDHITWECDYPHSDTTWPDSPEMLGTELVGVPDDEVNKITHVNAMRIFRFDPFGLGRANLHRRPLRAEAIGWDVEIRDLDTPWEPPPTPMTQQVKLEALGRMREEAERVG